jgi:hypothetical protein
MKSALVALRCPADELAARKLVTSGFLFRGVETVRLLAERSLALAVEVVFLWAAAWSAFRAVAATAVDAGKSDTKASRIVMGAFKRILKKSKEARKHQSTFYPIGATDPGKVTRRIPCTLRLTQR